MTYTEYLKAKKLLELKEEFQQSQLEDGIISRLKAYEGLDKLRVRIDEAAEKIKASELGQMGIQEQVDEQQEEALDECDLIHPTPFILINDIPLTPLQVTLLKGILDYARYTNDGLGRFLLNEKIEEIIGLMEKIV